MNPFTSVVVLKTYACCVRTIKVPEKEKQVITNHDEQSTRDQNQIKVLLLEMDLHHDYYDYFFTFKELQS